VPRVTAGDGSKAIFDLHRGAEGAVWVSVAHALAWIPVVTASSRRIFPSSSDILQAGLSMLQ
jgi:hypothetical protein